MATAYYDKPIRANCANWFKAAAVPRNRDRMGGGHGWSYRSYHSDVAIALPRTEAIAKRVISRCIEIICLTNLKGVHEFEENA